jgi:hypothetical protein
VGHGVAGGIEYGSMDLLEWSPGFETVKYGHEIAVLGL